MSSVPHRAKIKRIRSAAIVPQPVPDPVLVAVRSRRRRMVIRGLLIAAVLAFVIPITIWARYRILYVVSRNAAVKGTMTNLGAQFDGVVTSVQVDAGQPVKAGQVMAQFEDHQLQAAVQRAQSRLEKATRELEVERMAILQEERRLASRLTEASARASAAKAQVDAAESQSDDAKNRYELRRSLAQGGVISQEELRSADVSRRTAAALGATAKAEQKAAEAGRQLASVESDGLTVRQRHIEVLEAEVAGYRAELALAEADLRGAVIRAPADGWVVRRIAEPGASVVVGQPIVALWIGPEVWVETWVDENDFAKIAVGSPARVTLKPYPRRVFAGTVESIGVSTDFELPDTAVPEPRTARMRATPVVCVRVRLEDPEGLVPGLSAVVGIRKK